MKRPEGTRNVIQIFRRQQGFLPFDRSLIYFRKFTTHYTTNYDLKEYIKVNPNIRYLAYKKLG